LKNILFKDFSFAKDNDEPLVEKSNGEVSNETRASLASERFFEKQCSSKSSFLLKKMFFLWDIF